MQDGRIPKDIMYGELADTRPIGRPALWYKDICKRDLKAGSLNPTDLEAASTDRVSWWLAVRTSIKLSEGKRKDQWEKKRQRRRQSQCPQKQSQASPVATATDSAALILDCSATAGTAIPQQTDSGADTPLSPETEGYQRYIYKWLFLENIKFFDTKMNTTQAEGNVNSHLYSRERSSSKPFSCAAIINYMKNKMQEKKVQHSE